MNCLELRVNNIMERGDGGLVWGDLPAEREFESTSKWWAFRRLKWVCCFSFSEWFPMVILTIHNCSYSRGFWSFVFNVFLTWLILFIHKIPPPEIIQTMLSEHSGINIEISNRKIVGKPLKTRKLNNTSNHTQDQRIL